MKNILIMMMFILSTGCAVQQTPSPQASAIVNNGYPKVKMAMRPGSFDFVYRGDIVKALYALQEKQPSLVVLPYTGRRLPVSIRVKLFSTSLIGALAEIGEQGDGYAKINVKQDSESTKAFVSFN